VGDACCGEGAAALEGGAVSSGGAPTEHPATSTRTTTRPDLDLPTTEHLPASDLGHPIIERY